MTLAGWLDGGGDPARLLAALAGAALETTGRQIDPLPADTPAGGSERWLELLAGHGGYDSDGGDLV